MLMAFFKKKYTPNEIAEGLYSLCASEETINSSMQFYTQGKNPLDSNFHIKLRWHTYALHLFICDYICFQKYGDSPLKNKILDSFYKLVVDNLSGQPNDKLITKAMFSEINIYGDAVRGKSLDDLLLLIGKLFADAVDEPKESLFLMVAGSGIFTKFSVSIDKWLDEIKVII